MFQAQMQRSPGMKTRGSVSLSSNTSTIDYAASGPMKFWWSKRILVKLDAESFLVLGPVQSARCLFFAL